MLHAVHQGTVCFVAYCAQQAAMRHLCMAAHVSAQLHYQMRPLVVFIEQEQHVIDETGLQKGCKLQQS